MGFYDKIVEKYARKFNLTTEETKKMTKRIRNFILNESKKTNKITDVIILKSFFILEEMQKEHNKKLIKREELAKNKNIVIAKYYDEIVEKANLNWGSRRIAKYLKEAHKQKISHTTIYNFLKKVKNG